ncbi:MAG: Glycosyltransferase [Candidatus Rifleibacterium amylolyticum]|nr:MAG: Glycosyltransferase [Candidatus Rifleibacterium amylolyticum]
MNKNMESNNVQVSIVIPLVNEEETLNELVRQLSETLGEAGSAYEIIFVDDGSDDNSFTILSELYERHSNLKVIRFRRNFGKAAALQAGISEAAGAIIITMDADLQDSPKEIPRFLAELDKGYDIISGWKEKRHDPMHKTLPSKLFNWVTRWVSGICIHDFNCGFKAYRREVFEHVRLYGELHRYIPVLAGWKGFRVGEITVEHHARSTGQSKYGIERLPKGLFDLITIYVTRKYESRPLHIFGILGLLSGFVGVTALCYLTVLWFLGMGPIGTRPLLFFGILLTLFGGQLVSFGLLAEMISKAENRHENPYVISSRLSKTGVEK